MSLPYMKLFLGDYLKDTAELDTAELHGAYLLLLFDLWNRGGERQFDPDVLARVAKISGRRWPAIWARLEHFFTVENGTLSHRRIVRDLSQADELREKKSLAAKKSHDENSNRNKKTKPARADHPQHMPASASQSESEASLPASRTHARDAIQNSLGEGVADPEEFTDRISPKELDSLLDRFGLDVIVTVLRARTAGYRNSPLRSIGALVSEFEAERDKPKPAAPPPPPPPLVIPDGKPGRILREIIEAHGEAWAQNWLARCEWNGSELYAPGQIDVDRIDVKVGRILRKHGYEVVLRPGA